MVAVNLISLNCFWSIIIYNTLLVPVYKTVIWYFLCFKKTTKISLVTICSQPTEILISIAYIPHIVHCILMTFMLQLEICTCMLFPYFSSLLMPGPSGSHLFVYCIWKLASVLSHLFIFFVCFLHSTCKWNHTVFVFVWLISLSTILCRSIHVVANGKISFFFIAEQ